MCLKATKVKGVKQMRLINSEEIKKAIKVNKENGKQEIDSFAVLEIIQAQQNQIEEMRKQMLIFLGVLEKLEQNLDKRYEEITVKASSLELGAKDIQKGIQAGVSSSAKEIIKDLTTDELNKVIKNIKTTGETASEEIEKAGNKLKKELELANIFNYMSWVFIIIVVLAIAFSYWKMRIIEAKIDYNTYEIQRLIDTKGKK